MKRLTLIIFLSISMVLLFISVTGFAPKGDKHPEVDFSTSCVECHAENTPEVTTAWQEGQHGKFKVGCFICHGDGVDRFTAKPNDEACITCHSDYEVDWEKTKVKNCFDCHDGHTLKFHK